MRRIFSMIAAATLLGATLATPPGGPASVSAASEPLIASISHQQAVNVPTPAGPGIDIHQAVGATETQTGYQGWVFGIVNDTQEPVADPAITIASGRSPSSFPALSSPTTNACPGTVTRHGSAFPYTWADASLPVEPDDCYLFVSLPGVTGESGVMAAQDLMWEPVAPTDVQAPPISFEPGFDSFRSVDTTTVAPGGTQHVAAGVILRDPAPLVVVGFWSLMTPESITAITSPTDVPDCLTAPGPGTTCLWWGGPGAPQPEPGAKHVEWVLYNPVTGTEYDFAATFTNEGATPVDMIPQVEIHSDRTTVTATTAEPSVQVKDPDLDGATPGSGSATFSVGQAVDWTVEITDARWVMYPSATFTLPFAWSGFFAPVDNPGSGTAPVYNVMKAGAAVPVKFSLGGDRGLDVIAGITADQVPCSAFATLDGVEVTVAAGHSSLTYDAATDRYTYVWKTDKSWSSSASSCRLLDVRLTDGSHHRAYFDFTR